MAADTRGCPCADVRWCRWHEASERRGRRFRAANGNCAAEGVGEVQGTLRMCRIDERRHCVDQSWGAGISSESARAGGELMERSFGQLPRRGAASWNGREPVVPTNSCPSRAPRIAALRRKAGGRAHSTMSLCPAKAHALPRQGRRAIAHLLAHRTSLTLRTGRLRVTLAWPFGPATCTSMRWMRL